MPQPLLDIRGLTVEAGEKQTVPLLHEISLSLERGQVFGLVGESGCGKTMTALSVVGLLPNRVRVTGGEIDFAQRNLCALSAKEMRTVRGKHIAMIFQEPMTSLNPLLTIGEQMGEVLREHLGLKGAENRERCADLLKSVSIPEPGKACHYQPWQLSGGMRQRVMIATALSCSPELIIADEPTTALDVTTQAQILDLFNDFKARLDSSFIFVTHDLGVIAEIADRTAVIYSGYVVEECSAAALFDTPLHPYTYGLMRAREGRRAANKEALYTIPGVVPRVGQQGAGCPFAPRCNRAADICRKEVPPLEDAGRISGSAAGHKVRCWRLSK
jgi:oligopeptide/dipeptide ABC transporter ATP-binding protein